MLYYSRCPIMAAFGDMIAYACQLCIMKFKTSSPLLAFVIQKDTHFLSVYSSDVSLGYILLNFLVSLLSGIL
jgi:hypothetical protein